MNYPRGSEWRKWDLHIHSPASIYHNYPGDTNAAWESFLADLRNLPAEFKVLGINDYLFLDGYKRVLQEKNAGNLENIDLLLPVVELRLDKFVGHDSKFQRVNFHVIFDEIEPEVIETQFINQLSREFRLLPAHEDLEGLWSAVPTRDSLTDFGQMIIDAAPPERKKDYGKPLQEGFNNFNVALENVKKALSSSYFQNRHLTAVGKTEWDAIHWGDASIGEKRNVIHNADIVFTAAETVSNFNKARESLSSAKVNSRLLDCSDAHHLSNSDDKDRIGNSLTWVKSDTTFSGLQHAINEYEKRIFIGDMPEKLGQVDSSPTKYIKGITIAKEATSSLSEEWFDCDIPVNTDLVAIIGNKGSGKSALADTLGLLGDTKQSEHFSFLNSQKFRDPRSKKAAHFVATLTWQSGTKTSKNLGDNPDPSAVETVKYLPQNYVENLCNELVAGEHSEFDRELKQIIFSHVNTSERLGKETLDEVIEYLTAETQCTIDVLADKISSSNEEIAKLETAGAEAHRTELESRLRLKRQELDAHEKNKPVEVPEPTQSKELREAAKSIRATVDEKQKEIVELNVTIRSLDLEKEALSRNIAAIKKATARVENFRLQFDEFKATLTDVLSELDVELSVHFDDIVSVNIDKAKLSRLQGRLRTSLQEVDKKLDSKDDNTIVARKLKLDAEMKRLRESLDAPNRKFVNYRNLIEKWERKRDELIGSDSARESVKWLEFRIKSLTEIPQKLSEAQERRKIIATEIYDATRELADAYKDLYRPVQEFVSENQNLSETIPLSFEVSITQNRFDADFLGMINRQVRGTFSGIDEGAAKLRAKMNAVDFDDKDSVIGFVEEIDRALHFDLRESVDGEPLLSVSDQLRKGATPRSIYDYLYSLSFLKPRYKLNYGGYEINQLSPGERGLLLLVFYLLIDKDDIPLVIDQPEENLDNQTIYEVLVRCLGYAKERRQVIIVTHNPNLAVVCDAEQVIYAERDKANNALTYESGAIENPATNKHILDVLEGTRPAFRNRDSKYFD